MDASTHQADKDPVIHGDPLRIWCVALEAVVVLALASLKLVQFITLEPLLGGVNVTCKHTTTLHVARFYSVKTLIPLSFSHTNCHSRYPHLL